jgi:hypothetical protein
MKGEIGTSLLPEEQKNFNAHQGIFYFNYEKMRAKFLKNKANNDEFNRYQSMEDFLAQYVPKQ